VGAAPGDHAVLNVTPVNASGAGHGTVHASGAASGATSNVNFDLGSVDPNVAVTEVGADGKICFSNSAHSTVDVVVDQLATGSAAAFSPPTTDGAVRLVDTRSGLGASTLAPSAMVCVAAVGALPGDFAVLNVTPVNASGAGHGTMHAGGQVPGATSNVNFNIGTAGPNVAVTEVGADGRVCFSNSQHAMVDVVIDQMATGAADAFSAPSGQGAARLMDTRSGLGATTLAPSAVACVAAVGAVPGEFAVVNVTPVNATGLGFGTVHAGGQAAGGTSNVNFAVGSADPNVAITEVGADGRICFTNSRHSNVDVIIDQLATGAATAFRVPTDQGATRLFDTRP
jgi:hypothetical protein